MKNLLFRLDLDSGKYAGTGHFKRIEIIYKYLKKNNKYLKFHFLFKNLDNSKNTLNNLSEKNHIIYNHNFEKKLNFMNENDMIICDTPFGIDKKFKKFIEKKNIYKTILIDDLNQVNLSKGTIINGITFFKKKLNKTENLTIYQGPEYLLLNKKYTYKKLKKLKNKKKNPNVLVSLGGTDRDENLFKLAKILINIPKINLRIIIGSQVKKNNKIFKIKDSKLKLINSKSDIYNFISKSDIVICAGGITMFESIALRKPTLVFQTYNHQKFAINYLLKKKIISLIGKNKITYKNKIIRYINDFSNFSKKTNFNNINLDGKNFFTVIKIIQKMMIK